MVFHQLGLILIGLIAKILAADFECFSGVDQLKTVPCDKCKGFPIEVMLILDDSSSVRNSFGKERDFAIQFISAIQERFSSTKIGAVFFSECMTGPSLPEGWLITDYNPPGGWNCNTGTQQFLYPLGDYQTLLQAINVYDHGLHWGTPLSVGYDWAFQEIKDNGNSDRMRIVVMTSDGLPTRPKYDKGKERIPENENKAWQLVEKCDQRVTDMKNHGMISLTLDVGGQDLQAERNMRRWASEPRDRWAVQNIVDFDALLARLDDILDRLCFYIDSVTPIDGDKNCVKENQKLKIKGKNLFDMGQDSKIPYTQQNNVYDLESLHFITRIRIKADVQNVIGATFQGSFDKVKWIDMGNAINQESRYACEERRDANGVWCCIDPNDDGCKNTEKNCFCSNPDGGPEWFAYQDTSGIYSQYQYVRIVKNMVPIMSAFILEAEFYGKGAGSQKPMCRFLSRVTERKFYSEAVEVGPSTDYTEMTCNMPNTNGVYGEFTVEISRNGKDGAFTNNGRTIQHTDPNCAIPEDALVPTLPIPPTRSYFMPTPAPSSALKLATALYFYIFFFLFAIG